jgi:hypothetical protein
MRCEVAVDALKWRERAQLCVSCASPQDQVRDLVPLGHDQRRFALLVHAAEPTCVKKRLTPLPFTDAVGLAYLHRHTAARAGVAVAGNYNWLSSFHVPLISTEPETC